jgi:hypothetical protein
MAPPENYFLIEAKGIKYGMLQFRLQFVTIILQIFALYQKLYKRELARREYQLPFILNPNGHALPYKLNIVYPSTL